VLLNFSALIRLKEAQGCWEVNPPKKSRKCTEASGGTKANRELCGIPVSAAGDKKVKTTAKYFNPIRDIIQL